MITNMTNHELIVAVGQGIPGALNVALDMVMSGQRHVLERALERGVIGSGLWLAYKDLGDQTMRTLAVTIESDDLIERLAAVGYHVNAPHHTTDEAKAGGDASGSTSSDARSPMGSERLTSDAGHSNLTAALAQRKGAK